MNIKSELKSSFKRAILAQTNQTKQKKGASMKRIPDLLWCEIKKLLPSKKILVGRP